MLWQYFEPLIRRVCTDFKLFWVCELIPHDSDHVISEHVEPFLGSQVNESRSNLGWNFPKILSLSSYNRTNSKGVLLIFLNSYLVLDLSASHYVFLNTHTSCIFRHRNRICVFLNYFHLGTVLNVTPWMNETNLYSIVWNTIVKTRQKRKRDHLDITNSTAEKMQLVWR